jgi:hypothetical protein
MSTMRHLVSLLVFSASTTAALASSNLLVNGDFEGGIQSQAMGSYGYVESLPTGWVNYTSLRFGYSVYESNAYVFGTATNPPGTGLNPSPAIRAPNASSGSHLLAVGDYSAVGLTSPRNLFTNGGLTQYVDVVPGTSLTLSYDFQKSAQAGYGAAVDLFDPNTMQALSMVQVASSTANGWTTLTLSGVTSLSRVGVLIHATSSGTTTARDYLDNVSLSVSAVPEAGTAALMGMGMLGLLGLRRNRRGA